MSEEWKKHHITVDKVKDIVEYSIDGVLEKTGREERLLVDLLYNEVVLKEKLCNREREIDDKNNQIVKLKRQVSQLLERCEDAEKPNEMEWVEILWTEAQDGDFISYVFGDNDSPLWRAEERESMNENGIVLADMEKLDAMMKESEEE